MVLVFHLYPRTGVDRVRHVMRWSSCTAVEERDTRPAYTRGWDIRLHATLVCQSLGPQVFYAELESSQARSAALRASPPDTPYCVFGKTELVTYTAVYRAEREQTCHKLDGSLRRAAAPGRR